MNSLENRLQKVSKPVLKIAHLTDIHLNTEQATGSSLARCLANINTQAFNFILNGGDCIMDALETPAAQVSEYWQLWHRLWQQHNKLPVYHCLGNHDVWAHPDAADTTLIAKRWAMQELGLTNSYYSFDKKGWHFIVLDSTQPNEDGSWYKAQLDEAQFDWLAADLAKLPPQMPVLVLSHIPILSAAVFLDGDNEKTGNWQVPAKWMHIDARAIINLFANYPQVKLCLSGHLHLQDKVVYNGVSYYCNGALCGNWWKGNYQYTKPGYATVDLYADGSFEVNYLSDL